MIVTSREFETLSDKVLELETELKKYKDLISTDRGERFKVKHEIYEFQEQIREQINKIVEDKTNHLVKDLDNRITYLDRYKDDIQNDWTKFIYQVTESKDLINKVILENIKITNQMKTFTDIKKDYKSIKPLLNKIVTKGNPLTPKERELYECLNKLEVKTLKELVKVTGLKYDTIQKRRVRIIKKGFQFDIITNPNKI